MNGKIDRFKIQAHAMKVFGNQDTVDRWFREPNQLLGNRPPETVLLEVDGLSKVDAILSRIEHGVFS